MAQPSITLERVTRARPNEALSLRKSWPRTTFSGERGRSPYEDRPAQVLTTALARRNSSRFGGHCPRKMVCYEATYSSKDSPWGLGRRGAAGIIECGEGRGGSNRRTTRSRAADRADRTLLERMGR